MCHKIILIDQVLEMMRFMCYYVLISSHLKYLCLFITLRVLQVKSTTGPHRQRAGSHKKEADHSRLAEGSLNKKRNLHTRLVLGGHKRNSILDVYKEDFPGLFPGGASGKEPTCQSRRHKRRGFNPWVGKVPWRRTWQPTAAFLPGEFHGQRSLAGYSP